MQNWSELVLKKKPWNPRSLSFYTPWTTPKSICYYNKHLKPISIVSSLNFCVQKSDLLSGYFLVCQPVIFNHYHQFHIMSGRPWIKPLSGSSLLASHEITVKQKSRMLHLWRWIWPWVIVLVEKVTVGPGWWWGSCDDGFGHL